MIQCRENNIPKNKNKEQTNKLVFKKKQELLGTIFLWKNVLEYSNQFDMFEVY